MSLTQFRDKWCPPDSSPQPIAEQALQAVERRLAIRFPTAYRQGVLDVRLPWPTIALMDAIVERRLDLQGLSDFYTPDEIVEETLGWHEIGMPDHLVAFASDGCGNKFCFDSGRIARGDADRAAVWFFDHDFDTVAKVAPDFDAWITTFCEIEPWPDDGGN